MQNETLQKESVQLKPDFRKPITEGQIKPGGLSQNQVLKGFNNMVNHFTKNGGVTIMVSKKS